MKFKKLCCLVLSGIVLASAPRFKNNTCAATQHQLREAVSSVIVAGMSIMSVPLITLMVNYIPQCIQKFKEWKASSSAKVNYSGDLRKRLTKALEPVKGQSTAIDTIISSICGWRESKQAKNPGSNGSLVIHMAGLSGTGKSMTTDIIAKILMKNEKVMHISYSSINPSSKISCAEQLFGQMPYTIGVTPIMKKTPYASQLEHNSKIVVVIDEFDKFMEKDQSLEASLWDVADTGFLSIGKDVKIDCSETVFILTSNSSRESLGLDSSKDGQKKSLSNPRYHQAFLNRITSVYFEDFSSKIYKEILSERLTYVKDYYKKTFGIIVDIDDAALDTIADELANMPEGGARNVGMFINKLFVKLYNCRLLLKTQYKNKSSKNKITLTYENSEFVEL